MPEDRPSTDAPAAALNPRRWLAAYPEGTPTDVDVARHPSIAALIEESCEAHAEATAYSCLGAEMTYAALERRSRALAAYLQSLDLEKGARVAVMLPNILQSPVAVMAVLRAGYVLVNVNPLYTPRELKHQLVDAGVEAIILTELSAATLQKVIDETPVAHVVLTRIGDLLDPILGALVDAKLRYVARKIPFFHLPQAVSFKRALALGGRRAFLPPKLTREHVAALQYTGGSTGVAKGAVLTHGNLIAAVLSAEAWVDVAMRRRPLKQQAVAVCALPLYHIFAFVNCSLYMARMGGCSILIPNAADSASIVAALKGRVFHFLPGVDALFQRLLETPGFDRLDFSELRLALGGGMAVAPSTAARWAAATGAPLAEGYGSTETTSGVCCVPLDLDAYSGALGLPMPGMELRVLLDPADPAVPSIEADAVEAPVDAPGEIAVRGPAVMRGYWNAPEETAKVTTRDGFFRTGDIGRMDAAGHLTFVARKKNVIVVSGFNVFPGEIEAAAAEELGRDARDLAAVGAPDPVAGERVCLFIRGADVSVAALRAAWADDLTNYKRPRHVWVVDDFPRTKKLDVDHVALRARAAELAAAGAPDGARV